MNRLLRRLFGFSGGEPVTQVPLSSPAQTFPEPAAEAPFPGETFHHESRSPQYDVFLSYAHDDWEEAKLLEADLKTAGLTVWRDDRLHNAPDAHATEAIHQALQLSARVLVLWSNGSVKSLWVREEADAALQAEKIVCLALTQFATPAIPSAFRILPTIGLAQIRKDPGLLLRAIGAGEDARRPGLFALARPRLQIEHLPRAFAPVLCGRDEELRYLNETWDSGGANIVAFHAVGGAGKTALTAHFVRGLRSCGWRGAGAVFAWSFDSQGSSGDRQADSARFFEEAFAFFGAGPSQDRAKSEREKGVELARLLQARRALLILDGLEPLQYAAHTGGITQTHGPVGAIKDPAVKALLDALAQYNPGLCLITSNLEMSEFRDHSGFQSLALAGLDTVSGMRLLRALGVESQYPSADFLAWRELYGNLDRVGSGPALPQPRAGSFHLPTYRNFADRLPVEIESLNLPIQYNFPKDLESGLDKVDRSSGEPFPIAQAFKLLSTVARFEGHALSLSLLGNCLRTFHHGSIDAEREVPLLDIYGGDERKPFSVLRSVEVGLAKALADPTRNRNQHPGEADAGKRLAILLFLGFFDRPAPASLFPVVFPPVEFLPDPALEPPVDLSGLEHAYRKQDRHTGTWETEDAWKARALRMETERRALFRSLFPATRGYSGPQLAHTLAQLAAQGLLHQTNPDLPWDETGIDCHPLVRAYFGQRLRALDPGTFEAAHARLFDHFRFRDLPEPFQEPVAYGLLSSKSSFPDRDLHERIEDVVSGRRTRENSPHLPGAWFDADPAHLQRIAALVDQPVFQTALAQFHPEDPSQMEPLFLAIAHGCLARRHDECFNGVYWPRVCRGNENFAAEKLGLTGPDLAALAGFFEEPFRKPSPLLNLVDQTIVLNRAAVGLRSLGRYPEAVPALRTAVDLFTSFDDARELAVAYGNLSELLIPLGWLEDNDAGEGALTSSSRAVEFADQSGDLFTRMVTRASNHGAALLAFGRLGQAEERFREAERIEKEWQPALARLYSNAGYLYCDLLLARGRLSEVAERAFYALDSYERYQAGSPLDRALTRLQQTLCQSLQDPAFRLAEPLPVTESLQGAEEEALARCYLTRTEIFLNVEGGARIADFSREIAECLTEAERIAHHGSLPLILAEANLLAARTALALGGHDDLAWEHRNDAEALILSHHLGRREADLAVLDAEIARSLETFQAATTKVGAEGWWHLLPRLEQLAAKVPGAEPLLHPLRDGERSYHEERDAYLATQV